MYLRASLWSECAGLSSKHKIHFTYPPLKSVERVKSWEAKRGPTGFSGYLTIYNSIKRKS